MTVSNSHQGLSTDIKGMSDTTGDPNTAGDTQTDTPSTGEEMPVRAMVEPPVVPKSTSLPWTKILLLGIPVPLALCVLSVLLAPISIMIGVGALFLGTPAGAIVLGLAIHKRRHLTDDVGRFGKASVFGTVPQILGLGSQLLLLLLGVLFLVGLKGGFVDESLIPLAVILYAGIHGGIMFVVAGLLTLSTPAIMEERYAVMNRLPAWRLIRLNYLLNWVIYAIVIGTIGYTIISGII